MRQDNEWPFKQTFALDNRTGRFLKEGIERVPLFDAARRFSCVFLSTSAKDAARLNHHLLAAGIRAYHAADTREAEVLSAITGARILLVDIDHTFAPWLEFLQRLDESHPNLPKVVLTARHEGTWSLILSHFALDVVPKPAHLGDLLAALEHAHLVEQEINDPERVREREMRGDGGDPKRFATADPEAPPPETWKAHSIHLALDPGAPLCHDGQGDSCLAEIRLLSDPKATFSCLNRRWKPRIAAPG